MRRWVWIVLAVAIVGGGVYAWASTLRPSSGAQQIAAQQRMYIPVGRSTITRTLSYSGSLSPAQDKTITASSSGLVKEVLVSKGDIVRAGDVIARMDETEAQLELIRARREYEQARVESPAGVVEEKRLALVAAERRFSGTTIVAPFDGIIVDVFVREGDSVSSQGQIARLIDVSRYKVTLTVDQNDLAFVEVGQDVYVRPDAVSRLTLVGQIEEIGFLPSSSDSTTTYPVVIGIDPASAVVSAGAARNSAAAAGARMGGASGGFGGALGGAFSGAVGGAAGPGAGPPGPVAGAVVPGAGDRMSVSGPAGRAGGTAAVAPPSSTEAQQLVAELRPGMSVQAEIVIANAENVLVVPIASIVESGAEQLVTRLNADGVEEVVAIETGLTDGLYVEVVSGLSEGDRILTNNYALFQEVGNRATPGGRGGAGGFVGFGAAPASRVIIGR